MATWDLEDFEYWLDNIDEFDGVPNVIELDLSESHHLKSLPPEIGELTNLQALNVSENRLTSLPAEIGALTQLTVLTLNDNEITHLPPEIGLLTSLESFSMSDNKSKLLRQAQEPVSSLQDQQSWLPQSLTHFGIDCSRQGLK